MKKRILFLPCLIIVLVLMYQYTKDSSDSLSTTAYAKQTPVIVLDSGHGGYDTGGISAEGIYEKDITLSITLLAGEILEEEGYEVVYTRKSDEVSWSDDNLEDLKARVNIATMAQGDVFVSIHTNSSEVYNDGAFGIEAYYDGTDDDMEQLCAAMLSNLSDLNYTDDRGVKTTFDTPLYVIDQNNIPAMLLEIGFLSDSDDAAYMTSSEGQKAIAQAIANAIMSQY